MTDGVWLCYKREDNAAQESPLPMLFYVAGSQSVFTPLNCPQTCGWIILWFYMHIPDKKKAFRWEFSHFSNRIFPGEFEIKIPHDGYGFLRGNRPNWLAFTIWKPNVYAKYPRDWFDTAHIHVTPLLLKIKRRSGALIPVHLRKSIVSRMVCFCFVFLTGISGGFHDSIMLKPMYPRFEFSVFFGSNLIIL